MELGKGGAGWHDEAAERERTGGNPWVALRPMTEAESAQWVNEQCQKALEVALVATCKVKEPTAEEKAQRIVTVNVTLTPAQPKEIHPGDEVLIAYGVSQYFNQTGFVINNPVNDIVVAVQFQDNSFVYFTKEELHVLRPATDFTKPAQSDVNRVLAWLSSNAQPNIARKNNP